MSIPLRAPLLAGALAILAPAALAAPITLPDALPQVVQISPRIAQAWAQLEAARARAVQAGVQPNPELELEVENFAGSGPYRTVRSAETTLAVSQRLELGGRRGARVAVSRAELKAAELGLERAQGDLARDVRLAHAELAAAEARATLARSNAGRAQELSRTAAVLVEAGRDPPLRKLRADALLAEARAEEARSFGVLLTARRSLGLLTGSDDLELSAVESAEPAPQIALGPETRTLDERVAEAAHAEALAAEANLAQVRLDVRRAQYDARMVLAAANARVEALAGPGIAQAAETLRLAELGYRAGKFSLVELIDTQTALNSARLALIEARLDQARALAALIRAQAQ